MNTRALFLGLFLSACASGGTSLPAQTPTISARIVGYYYGPTGTRGFPVSNIRADLLTHINYAFGQVNPDGTVAIDNPSFDTTNFAALRALKQRYPHLQVLIAFGGWGGSKYFSDAASTPEMRGRFAQSVIDVFLRAYPDVFDGVDLDWEYPVGGGASGNINRPEDRTNLTALVEEMRRRLDDYAGTSHKHYLITIAGPAGPNQLAKYEMNRLAQLLDFINVMTYDYHTAGNLTNYNAPLASPPDDPSPNLNVKNSVAAYLAAGVPAKKVVVGLPFYGYVYSAVGADAAGRYQPIENVAPADSTAPLPAAAPKKYVGAMRYNQLISALKDGFEPHWDDVARVPWLYNPTTHTWITYDDPRSLGEKAAYARSSGLGGVVIWELSGDDGTLLPAISASLK